MPASAVTITAANSHGISGAELDAADGSNGNAWNNSGVERMLIYNPDATSLTAIISVPSTTDALVDTLAVPDAVIAAFTDELYILQRMPKEIYNQTGATDTGKVIVTLAGTLTNVKCIVVGN